MLDTSEIYMNYCGSECPCPEEYCSMCGHNGECLLEEPWFDCSDFQSANMLDICAAEAEIDSLEAEEEEE